MAGANEHTDGHYEHGTMDVTEQASTFSLVMALLKWNALAFAALIFGLVLWFRPGGSFLPGLIGGGLVAVLGWWYLRKKPAAH